MNSKIIGRRVFQHSLIIGTTLVTCTALQANDHQTKSQGGPAATERGAKAGHQKTPEEFVQKAMHCSQMEIQRGQLAQQKGQNQQVKDLGAVLVRDHTQVNQRLQRLAQDLNVSKTTKAHVEHDKQDKQQQDFESLKNQSGAEFDKAFVTHVIKDHKKGIAQAEKCQKEEQNPQLKAFIDETLPKLRQHLQMAQTAARAVGVDEAKITLDLESESDAVGAPAAGVTGEKSDPYKADVDANVDADRNDVDVKADLNTEDNDNGKVFQKGDGKVLGLSTSKSDGKILGVIPAPGRRDNEASAQVEATTDREIDSAIGAPGVSETGRSAAIELRFTEAPAAVRQALRDQGLTGEGSRLKKMTIYEADVNGKKIHVTEEGKVYQHGRIDQYEKSNR